MLKLSESLKSIKNSFYGKSNKKTSVGRIAYLTKDIEFGGKKYPEGTEVIVCEDASVMMRGWGFILPDGQVICETGYNSLRFDEKVCGVQTGRNKSLIKKNDPKEGTILYTNKEITYKGKNYQNGTKVRAIQVYDGYATRLRI